MKHRYAGHPAFILGFHGCDKSLADSVLAGDADLVASTNNYDWLGHGIYFWEGNPGRAREWAEKRMQLPDSSIKEPDVVGAIIDLGFSLSFTQSDHLKLLEGSYTALKEFCELKENDIPENTGGADRFLRRLDCAVIQWLHKDRTNAGQEPFDSVRGLFQEGSEVYPGGSFRIGNHIQICVRNRACIKGYFRPMAMVTEQTEQ